MEIIYVNYKNTEEAGRKKARFESAGLSLIKTEQVGFGKFKLYYDYISDKSEPKYWYFGTSRNKWYLARKSEVPEYKREEFITQSQMKKIGRRKAREMVLSPSFIGR